MRKNWLILALAALLLLAMPMPSIAGVLTSSNYTYLLKGQELQLPIDVLTLQGQRLVPVELLAAFDLVPAEDGGTITLSRGPVIVQMELGSKIALIADKVRLLGAAPVRVSGRLFLPAEVLPDLGAQVEVDGSFVLLTDYLTEEADAPVIPYPDFAVLRTNHTVSGMVQRAGAALNLKITLLTPELLADSALGFTWGTRLRLHSMLKTGTLLLVQVENQSLRAAALEPAHLMLIGTGGHQYDYNGTEIAIDGQVTQSIAPGARKASVLAFPRVAERQLDLYYDGSSTTLGRLPRR